MDYSGLAVLVKGIHSQLQDSGRLHGYRWIYAKWTVREERGYSGALC